MRLSPRRLAGSLVLPLAILAAVTCTGTDRSVAPAPTASTHRAALSFKTIFSPGASQALTVYQAANLTIDRVRVVIVRPPSDTLKDTTVATTPGQPDFVLDLEVAAVPGEQLQGGLEFRSGSTVLFSGQGTVVAHALNDPSPANPLPITVVAVGPGANAAKVVVAPATGSFPTAASVVFTAHASTSLGADIPGALFAWSVDDATVATIDASAGVVTPTTKGGTVHVRATTLNGTFGEAVITFFPPPARIVVLSGGGQTGEVGTALPLPLIVQVQAANGVPVPNQTVVFGTSNGASVSPASVVSDASGMAQTTLTQGNTLGTYTFAASTATFNASATETATAGAPATIVVVSGSGQTDTVQHTLKLPLVVKVADRFGNAKNGAVVNWVRATGGGAVSAPSTTTGTDGQTSIGYTLGTAVGSESVNATVGGVTAPATFTMASVAGRPATVTTVSGSGQTGAAGSSIGNALVISVVDSIGNPVNGAPVTWVVTSGTATLVNAQATTGLDGRATATLTLGATAGPVVVTATVGGRTVTFNLTIVSSSATTLALASGGGQTAAAGTVLAPIAVRVTDAQGNPVASDNVTFTVGTGGGSVSSSGTTDAQGLAHATWTLGSALGTQTLIATRTGLTGSPLTISATATAPAVAVGLAFLVQPSSTTTGAVIAPAVTVRAVDLLGNTVPTFTGTISLGFASNPGDVSLGGTVSRTAIAGVATFNDLTVANTGIGYSLSASSVSLAGATSTPFNVTLPSAADTWTGAASTDFSAAGNWTSGVPTTTTNVLIPASTPHQPVLSSTVVINDLTINSGATLSLGAFGLTATGNVDAAGGVTGTGSVTLSGTGKTVDGTFSNVSVTGAAATVATTGTTSISGILAVTGSAVFTVGSGTTLTAGATSVPSGSMVVSGGSTTLASILVSGSFTQSGGILTITGAATFSGTVGNFTGGQLLLAGNFTQGGSANAFAASGTHRTTFNGSAAQTIQFTSVGAAHFHDLEFAGTGTVSMLNGAIVATGQLISPAGPSTVHGNGGLLQVAGLAVDGLVLDNVTISSTDGAIAQFDNVTFQNYATTATPLTIVQAGGAAPYVFNNTQFLVTPTTGHFLSVTDDAPADGNVLTINLAGSTPVNGTSATVTGGGAIVTWGAPSVAEAWTNPSGGLWSVPTNWSLGRAPVSGDSVVIALAGTYTVTLDAAFTSTYVTVGGGAGTQTLAVTSLPLTINTVMTVRSGGAFVLSNTLAGAGSLSNSGTMTLRGATINIPVNNLGNIVVNNNSTIGGSLTANTGSTILIQSDGSTGNDVFTVANGFTNHGSIQLSSTVGAYGAQLSVTNGTLTNAVDGTIATLVGSGGPRLLDVTLKNQGALTLSAPLSLSHTNAVSSNSGTIDATAADFAITQTASGTFTNTGTLTIGAGHLWSVSGGLFDLEAPVNGPGTLSLSNVGSAAFNSTFTLGAITMASSSATFANSFSTATTTLAAANSSLGGPATITNVAGKTLTLIAANLLSPVSVINQGILLVSSSSTITGSITAALGSTIRIQSDGSTGNDVLTVANGFTNDGTIELSSTVGAYGSAIAVTAGSLTNAADGTIAALPGTGGPRQISAALINQGSITINAPLTLAPPTGNSSNSGTIDLVSSDFTVSQTAGGQTFTNTGTVNDRSSQTWTFNGGAFTQQTGGVISGGGALVLNTTTTSLLTGFSLSSLHVSGGAIAFQNDVITTGLPMQFLNTTVSGPGQITNVGGQTMSLNNVTFAANSGIINQGTLLVTSSSTINGPLTIGLTSIIQIQSDGSTGNDVLTVANGFTNNGAINLASTVGAYGAALVVTNGTFTNAVGANLTSLVGTGGPRVVDADFTNLGLVTVNEPLTLQHAAGGAQSNAGTIDVFGGDFAVTQGGVSPSFTNTGTVNISAGRTWAISGGTLAQQTGAALVGGGALVLSNTTANLATAFTLGSISMVSSNVTFGTNISTTSTTLNIDGSTVNGPGTITNAAGQTITLRNSTIGSTTALTNQGTLLVHAATNINAPLTTAVGSTILVESDGSTGSDVLTVASGFTNNGAIQLSSTVGAYDSQLLITSGTLTNAASGTITAAVGTGGNRALNAALANLGAVTVNEPMTITNNSGADTNDGTITVATGDLAVNQSGTTPTFVVQGTGGAVHVQPGRTFSVNGGSFTLQASSTVDGNGAMVLTNAVANFANGFTLTALTANSSTVAFAHPVSTTGLLLTFNSAVIDGPGAITNVAGQTLTMRSSTIDLSSGLANQGTLLVYNSSAINGPFTNVTGATTTVESDGSTGNDVLTVANGFTNTGAIQLSSTVGAYNSQLSVTNGNLTNASGGTISALVGTGGSRLLDATLFNQGLVTINETLTLAHANAAHDNAGTINLAGGDFTVTESGSEPDFINTGTVNVPAGRTVTIGGGSFELESASTLSGGGALVLNTVATSFGAPFVLSALTINNGSALFQGDVSNAGGLALTLNGPTINGVGSNVLTNAAGQTVLMKNTTVNSSIGIQNAGTLIVNASSSLLGGLTTVTGSTLLIQSDGSTGNDVLTISNNVFNNGLIQLSSTIGAYDSQLAVGGTLTNNSAGTISTLAGTGGARTIAANVTNSGTMNIVPSGVGSLTITGGLTNTSTGVVNLELASASSYDAVHISGAITLLGGTLNVTTLGGFTPVAGNDFVLFTYASAIGQGDFTTYNLPDGNGFWARAITPGGTALDIVRTLGP